MICDALRNAQRYESLHPRFRDAFAWCRATDFDRVADGRIELAGDSLFVVLESGMTHPAHTRRFESHRRYIDIQVNLRGPELMEWTPLAGLAVDTDFQPDNDIAFYREPALPATRLLVAPGHFTIFWPQDAHKPVCSPGNEPVPYRKFVMKVAV